MKIMEAITIHPQNAEQLNALEALFKAMKIPFEKKQSEKEAYNPEFVAKMRKSRQQAKEGKTIKVHLDDLWK